MGPLPNALSLTYGLILQVIESLGCRVLGVVKVPSCLEAVMNGEFVWWFQSFRGQES